MDFFIILGYSSQFGYSLGNSNKNMQQQHKQTSPQPQSQQSPNIYSQVLQTFHHKSTRLNQHLESLFDDRQMVQYSRRTLPKLELSIKNRVYFSKILVEEVGEMGQEKRQDRQKDKERGKERGREVLASRNRRIMQLYMRGRGNGEGDGMTIVNPEYEAAAESSRHSSDKKIVDRLREVSEKRKKYDLPLVKSPRSKSTMLLHSGSESPDKSTLKCQKFGVPEAENKQKQRRRQQQQKQTQSRTQSLIKRPRMHWNAQPLPICHVTKQQFHSLLRYYLKIDEIAPLPSGYYKAYIGPGNNCALIKKLLKERGCWSFVDSMEQKPNFVWTQLRDDRYVGAIRECGVLKESVRGRKYAGNVVELGNFLKMKKNDYTMCCQKLLLPQQYLTLIDHLRQRCLYSKNFTQFTKLRQYYTQYLQPHLYLTSLPCLQAAQINSHNHLPYSQSIGDKKNLLQMLKLYCQLMDQNLDQLIPVTFHMSSITQIPELLARIPIGPWIVKPGEGTNRGQGITVHINQSDLLQQLAKTNTKKHKDTTLIYTTIIQKYIQPLLYNGRKFDIRIWVLWSGGKLWWYRQGYVRTSSKQFTYKSMSKYIHLTNDAIQSKSQDFGKYEPANKISFAELQKYLQTRHNYHGFHSDLLPRMKCSAMKAFRMASLLLPQKPTCFQLFGLDFLLDHDLHPWLIECNTNPCLEINCSLLARLVPGMLDNLMNMTVDVMFPGRRREGEWKQGAWRWELLYDGDGDWEIGERLGAKGVDLRGLVQAG